MKISFILLFTLFISLILTTLAFGQPPGLPSTAPSQAPIDGGLGLLAAAGGAYAWKKLRDKKRSDAR